VNANEFQALGVVLCKFRDAVDQIDAALLTAFAICAETDSSLAVDVALARTAALDCLTSVDDLLASPEQRKRAS
jgi:hypothetical protein